MATSTPLQPIKFHRRFTIFSRVKLNSGVFFGQDTLVSVAELKMKVIYMAIFGSNGH